MLLVMDLSQLTTREIVKLDELTPDEKYQIIKDRPDFKDVFYPLDGQKCMDFLIYGIRAQLKGKVKRVVNGKRVVLERGFIDGKEVVAENREKLLAKMGDILKEEYNFPWPTIMGWYCYVSLQ